MNRRNDVDLAWNVLPALFALVVCIFVWPSLLTFDAGDWPSPHQYPHHAPTSNACGSLGSWIAYQLRYVLGDGVYPLLLFATMAAVLRLARREVGRVWERALGLALVTACTSASTHLISAHDLSALPVGHGGLIGFALGEWLKQSASRVGTLIVLVSGLLVGLVFVTEGWILTLPSLVQRAGQATTRTLAAARARAKASAVPQHVAIGGGVAAAESAPLPTAQATESRAAGRGAAARTTVEEDELADTPEEEWEEEDGDPHDNDSTGEHEEVGAAEEPRTKTAGRAKSKKRAKATPELVVNYPVAQPAASMEPYPRHIENWELPPLSLLEKPEYGFTARQEAVVREQAHVLERTLEEFRLDAHVVEIDTGPVITMFELKLGVGIKVSQIATLSNDLARALKAHAIRVVAPISGKNTVGIEVPNIRKEKVRLSELITLAGGKASDMGLPLFLGKDAGGAALVADLTKMPHMLIAGTTGSGKSVCLTSMIVSLLMTKRPDHVKMILIDPKMVEMSQFKSVPHLMCPIVTDMVRGEQILEWAVTKMEERYELLAEARVKNIASYNSLGEEELHARLEPVGEEEKTRIPVHLPYIVVVIDELADLMMTSGKEVEHHLSRLAQKSRAIGIHIIVATQRPEARVVTGLIKSNLPSRVCFRVASRMDSRIVLDQNGGEVLLGQGDMLFLPPGSHKLIRAQGTYLEDAEVQAVLANLSSRAEPEFHPELVQLQSGGSGGGGGARDPLFENAVRVVLESQRGSVSLLQRRLTVGYSRASRLIDQMSDAGIVGAFKGSQAREVLMTRESWDALQQQVRADLDEGYEADQDADEPDTDEVPALTDSHDIRG